MKMKARVAMYKNLKYGHNTVAEESLDGCDDYARLTEFVDVEFSILPYGEPERKQAEAIDKQIASHEAEIELLTRRKAELLAIPYDGGGQE